MREDEGEDELEDGIDDAARATTMDAMRAERRAPTDPASTPVVVPGSFCNYRRGAPRCFRVRFMIPNFRFFGDYARRLCVLVMAVISFNI